MSETTIASTAKDPRPPAVICRERGWGPGTLLAGDEGYGVTVIEVTALGRSGILARTVAHDGTATDGDESSWTLDCRDWHPVDPAEVPQPIPAGSRARTSEGAEGVIESGPDRYGAYVVIETDGTKWLVRASALTVVT